MSGRYAATARLDELVEVFEVEADRTDDPSATAVPRTVGRTTRRREPVDHRGLMRLARRQAHALLACLALDLIAAAA